VVGQVHLRHRQQEFIKFLRRLEREFAKDLELHLILDNYGTHTHPEVKAWLAKHARFRLHFIPTGSSWLNLIERWFAELTNKAIRRGSFPGVGELVTAIHEFLEASNRDPTLYVWTASANTILEKVAHCKAILQTEH
jgi:transposase